MIEYVVSNAFAALPQRILHSSEDGSQSSPAIARLANGGFVTGWTSNSALFVQRYDAQGAKVGGEQLIASGVYDDQLSLVGLSGGGFAAAWSGTSGVLARTFDASGNALSNVFSASTAPSTFLMQQPALSANANNGFVLAWTDSSSGSSQIKARVFDHLGTGTIAEIAVTAPPLTNNYYPRVSVQADGDFLVSWTGPHTRASGESTFTAANARLFDAAGNAKSGVVSSYDSASVPFYYDGYYQSITTLKSGGFVTTWTSGAGDDTTIRGQLYAADATPIGAQFQVNPADGLSAGQSTVTALDNGGFLVTWRVDTDDGGPNYFQRGDVLAQAFNASAVKVGSAFRVNDNVPLGQDKPVVTAFGSGDFAFTFRTFTDTGESDIAIKLYYSATNGTAGNDTITGTADVDYINGLAGNEILNGGSSNDVLDGGAGNDTLIGGAGYDTYFVDTQGDVIFENAGEGYDTVFASAGFYLYANIEALTLTGTGGIFGVGNALNNVITGNSGANLLLGGEGDDTINGGAGGDSLFGEAGNDTLNGDAGIDYLVGGAGNDTLNGGADADALYGEEGDDVLDGGATFHTDILVGGAGNDTLKGASGLGDYDLLNGGPGDDIYFVDTPDDLTFEAAGEGTDTVYANINGAGYYLYAFTENLVLQGNTPFGVGNELDNRLTGNAIGNYLLGGLGNDTLNGKGGNDVLFGEGGADTFVFERGTGGDVIGDFQAGVDKIRLEGLGFATYAALQPNIFQVGGNTGINLGQGDFIVLNGVAMAQLSAADFLFG